MKSQGVSSCKNNIISDDVTINITFYGGKYMHLYFPPKHDIVKATNYPTDFKASGLTHCTLGYKMADMKNPSASL